MCLWCLAWLNINIIIVLLDSQDMYSTYQDLFVCLSQLKRSWYKDVKFSVMFITKNLDIVCLHSSLFSILGAFGLGYN